MENEKKRNIYENNVKTMTAFEAKPVEKLSLKEVTVKAVKDLGHTGSEVVFRHNDGSMVEYATNSPKKYWKVYEGIPINVTGILEKGTLLVKSCRNALIESAIYKGAIIMGFEVEDIKEGYGVLSAGMKKQLNDILLNKVIENDKIYFRTLDELKVKAAILAETYPEDVRSKIVSHIDDLTKNTDNIDSALKRTTTMALGTLVNYPFYSLGQTMINPLSVREAIENFPLSPNAAKQLIREYEKVYFSKSHKTPNIILLVGSGASSVGFALSRTFAQAMDKKFGFVDVALRHDQVYYSGSDLGYANSSMGGMAKQLMDVGDGVLLFSNVDQIDDSEMGLLSQLSQGFIENAMLQVSIETAHTWIICTATSSEKLSRSMQEKSTIINIGDIRPKEMIEYGKKCLMHSAKEYRLDNEIDVSEEVYELLCDAYIRKGCVEDVERNMDNLAISIKRKVSNSGEPVKIDLSNITEYYSVTIETSLSEVVVKDFLELEEKFIRNKMRYPDDVRRRIQELLDMRYGKKNSTNAIEYIKEALTLLVNVDYYPIAKNAGIIPLRAWEKKTFYGLDSVFERILDTLSGSERVRGIILYGAPGIGKTMILNLLVDFLGKKHVIIHCNTSVQAKPLEGTKRTVDGAEAGIFKEIAMTGTTSVVILGDELDKAEDFSAYYNLLDTSDIHDNYLEVEIPTDNMTFFFTANDISKIPAAIRDRCTLIHVPGYSFDEKKQIAKKNIIPKYKSFDPDFDIDDELLEYIIRNYAMAPGVRDLYGVIEDIYARNNRYKCEGRASEIKKDFVTALLGVGENHIYNRTTFSDNCIGHANALAVMGYQGTTSSIEIEPLADKETPIKVTGQLIGSCKESLERTLAVCERYLGYEIKGVAINFTGGTEKDGPSAGITFAVAILSYFLKIPVPKDVAFTGELSLNGSVDSVGSVDEKLRIADFCGFKRVYIPLDNYLDLTVRKQISKYRVEVIPIKSIYDIIDYLFTKAA